MLTATELARCMPGAKPSVLAAYLPHLQAAMLEGDIITRRRAAAFLAQLGHESASLRYMEEIASGRDYEGRRDLGNVFPGDGVKFKGRGPIQLTGRANYKRAGAALGLDRINHPELAATKEVGFRVAVWFWRTRGLNELADRSAFKTITRRINGGLNGWADRWRRYQLCLAALKGWS